MSAFSVENPHDGKMFENYTRFEWGVEVGVVTIFVVRLFVPHEFDMYTLLSKECSCMAKMDAFRSSISRRFYSSMSSALCSLPASKTPVSNTHH